MLNLEIAFTQCCGLVKQTDLKPSVDSQDANYSMASVMPATTFQGFDKAVVMTATLNVTRPLYLIDSLIKLQHCYNTAIHVVVP